jgi:uncharacterized circularly permuted ATP-grasp superfamily protein/uncharacterized alpha-E superfamily protein
MADRPPLDGLTWLRYEPRPGVFDEMVAADGTVRPHWRDLLAWLDALGPDEMAARAERAHRLVRDNGVTYNIHGESSGYDRPWTLDPVPLLLNEDDWREIERSVIQRATLLNAVMADLYGPRHLLTEGSLPPALIHGNPNYMRPMVGARPADGVFLHVLAFDLVRASDGRWWVMDSRCEVPSGIGYALENRVIMNRVLPQIIQDMPVHRLAASLNALRESLIGRTPMPRERPRVVLWTPGPFNETYFEHIYLTRYMGFTLVEGEDLTVRDGRVFLKTLGGLQPVDVILRRNESSFCDPLELRGDSTLGAPGLVEAAHDGTVTLANALGAGLVESPGLMAFLPSLCHRLLGQDLIMPSVATWWCGQARERGYVLRDLESLVVRSAFNVSGPVTRGADLDPARRAALAADIERSPHAWVGQEAVNLSTTPVWTEGGLEPHSMVARIHVFAQGGEYQVVPGALVRVSGPGGQRGVSMQRGGGSKDAWVLSDHPAPLPHRPRSAGQSVTVVRGVRDLPSRVADDLFWLGRYVERCDAIVRLMRAMVGRLAETGAGSLETGVILDMLWPLGHPPFSTPAGPDPAERYGAVCDILEANLNPLNGRGLAALVLDVHRVGLRVRDRLSVDNWRAIDALIAALGLSGYAGADGSVPAPRPPRLTPEDAGHRLSDVLMPLQVLAGLANENMTRGLGWRFLDTGRRIERSLHILDLFDGVARTADEARHAALDVALEVSDSHMTYRARYLDAAQTVPVLDILLADESNPRSLAYQLARLGMHMDSLAPDQAFGLRTHEQRLAVRLLGITRTVDLDRMHLGNGTPATGDGPPPEPDEAMPPPVDLPSLLHLLRGLLNALSDSLARQYFAHAVETRHGSGLGAGPEDTGP